jgi:hypothetical protein
MMQVKIYTIPLFGGDWIGFKNPFLICLKQKV